MTEYETPVEPNFNQYARDPELIEYQRENPMTSELNGISIKQVLMDDVNGITIYSDGTKAYWGEGYGVTTYVKTDGTKWFEQTFWDEDEQSDYNRLAIGMGDKYDWDDSTDREMTEAERAEYREITGE